MIITIILLAFLVLLMVSMAALTRVETQIASNYQKVDQARSNALFGLKIALGKLQATAGPDQRITASGDILGTTHASKKNWTGVWDSTTGTNLGWLASDPATPTNTTAAPTLASATTYNDDTHGYVRLVGSATTNATVAGNEIIVPLQSLTSSKVPGLGNTSATIGRYGWWIGDEGVKARINLDDPNAERVATTTGSPSAAAVAPTNSQKLQSLMVPGRTGGELLATDTSLANNIVLSNSANWPWSVVSSGTAATPTYLSDTTYVATSTTSASTANFLRDLGKVLCNSQIELLGSGFTSSFRKNRFYDFTLDSRGVLADVAAGGLKKDLTAGLLGSTIPASITNATKLFTVPASGAPTLTPAGLPAWGSLRSYAQLQNSLSGSTPSIAPRATTDTQMGVYPVVARFQLWVHATVESDNTLRILYFPAVVLWNPYDVTIQASAYAGQYKCFMTDYSVRAYAEFAGSTKWKWGTDTFYGFSYGLAPSWQTNSIFSKGFILQSPAIPPGQAIVFTPSSNVNYVGATPAQLTLTPGWRTYCWYEPLNTSPTAQNSSPAPTASDTPNRLMIAPQNNGESGFLLYYLGPTGTAYVGTGANAPYDPPTGPLLQLITGNAWWSSSVGLVGSSPPNSVNGVTLKSTSFLPDTVNDGLKEITLPSQTPAGMLAISAASPALGWFATMKMSSQPNISGSSSNDNTSGIAWLAQYNPAAPAIVRTALDNAKNVTNSGYSYASTPNYNKASISSSASVFNNFQCTGNNVYLGYSMDDSTGQITQEVLFHLPRSETGTLSLGALQHANVHPSTGLLTYPASPKTSYAPNAMPAYAIGNSYIDPRVLSTDTDGFPDWSDGSTWAGGYRKFHVDLSYVLNKTLWDKYYFSSVPTNGTPSFPLANPRHVLYDPSNLGASGLASSLQNFDKAANNLLITGAFNINSTSREAWRALLASTRKAPVLKQDGTTAMVSNAQYTPIPRVSYPLDNNVDSTSSTTLSETKAAVYDGFRNLTDAQIDALATQIVTQIKARAADSNYGPFRSLADFINRRPAASTTGYQLSGALQSAIDATTINGTAAGSGLKVLANLSGVKVPSSLTSLISSYTTTYFQQSAAIPRTAATPGYLTQADLLQVLGPVLSARSDTFRIRTYGEVVDPLNSTTGSPKIQSRAWCEAIVQRVPDYLDQFDTNITTLGNATPPSSTNTTNQTLGRRFKIVSFRWLTPADL